MKVPGRLDWEWAPLEMDEGGRERAIENEAGDENENDSRGVCLCFTVATI